MSETLEERLNSIDASINAKKRDEDESAHVFVARLKRTFTCEIQPLLDKMIPFLESKHFVVELQSDLGGHQSIEATLDVRDENWEGVYAWKFSADGRKKLITLKLIINGHLISDREVSSNANNMKIYEDSIVDFYQKIQEDDILW